VIGVSSLWETAPIGDIPQGDYLNAVVVLDTVAGPRPLLAEFLGIEADAGRERRERWGPRPLDLDLLLCGDAVIDTPGLQVPHPRMTGRRFVLEPLAEVWPDAVVPGRGAVATLLAGVQDQGVRRVDGAEWTRVFGSP
jgi:2-amino-4-hydroxy-6-hydroxymethyldihydropteridine diphosphokinase